LANQHCIGVVHGELYALLRFPLNSGHVYQRRSRHSHMHRQQFRYASRDTSSDVSGNQIIKKQLVSNQRLLCFVHKKNIKLCFQKQITLKKCCWRNRVFWIYDNLVAFHYDTRYFLLFNPLFCILLIFSPSICFCLPQVKNIIGKRLQLICFICCIIILDRSSGLFNFNDKL